MKSNNSRSMLTSGILKLVGIILILSSLVDYVSLVIPPAKPGNIDAAQWQLNVLQWQQTVTGSLIDRGIIPMVGLALLLVGFWIDRESENYQREAWQEIVRVASLALSAILGLAFIVVLVLNVNSVRSLTNENVKGINQQASQVETSIQRQSQQVGTLLQDSQKLQELDQAIKSGKVQGEQLVQLQTLQQRLQQFKGDPKALKQEVEKLQLQVRSRKLEAENQAKGQFWRSIIKNTISGLLLVAGYMAIAWWGLVGTGTGTGSSRSSRRSSQSY